MAINYDKFIFSDTTHYISNSGSDENGKSTGGKAGDQTGKEWCLKAWYNRPWTVVLRYPDQTVALKIAELGIAAALNDKIGYDQSQRSTYWTQLKAAGYDPSKITTACEEDCTAGVTANVKAAGHIFGIAPLETLGTDTRSSNMRSRFVAAGFTALTASKYLSSGKYLLPGDILLYENHHAATNITCGTAVRADWHPGKLPDDPAADDGRQYVVATASVNIRKGPSKDYAIMGTIRPDQKLPYFGYANPGNGWYLVEFERATGWISPKYTRLT